MKIWQIAVLVLIVAVIGLVIYRQFPHNTTISISPNEGNIYDLDGNIVGHI